MTALPSLEIRSRSEPQTRFNRLELAVLLTQATIGIGLISWMLWSCRRGVDFTDEGFYLNWISYPSLYEASHTLFGFVYHPLYIALGSDVVVLRQANILITIGLAWVLFRLVLSDRIFPWMAKSAHMGLGLAVLTLTFATGALGILNIAWIPTPSYNTLALQALMITSIGLVLTRPHDSKASFTGSAFIGFGGWLAFMAKPTTAVMLGLIVLGHLTISGTLRIRQLAFTFIVTLLLLVGSAWYIDGNLSDFIGRLADGVADLRLLQGGYESSHLLRIDSFSLTPLETWTFSISTGWLCLTGMLPVRERDNLTWIIPGVTTALALSVVVLALQRTISPYWLPFLGLQSLAIPAGAAFIALLSIRQMSAEPPDRRRMGLVLCMLAMPYAFAVGTNNNYWSVAGRASMFWVLAGLLVLPPKFHPNQLKRIIGTMAATTLMATTWVLYSNTENPYRQTQPLRLNQTQTKFASGSKLLLSEDFARYLQHLMDLSRDAGFNSGEPMLDWTGHYPTALHAVGAKPLGIAWLGGGYKGSNDMVAAALDRVPRAELLRAWILTEPEGIRALSVNLLKRYGIDLERDYTLVGSLDSPTGTYPTRYKQYLWRPARRSPR